MEEYIVEIDSEGIATWRQDGKIHRIDGPAVKHPSGLKFWYIYGIDYSRGEFNKIINQEKNTKTIELTIEQISFLLRHKVEIIK
jgi:hypothetical protein